MSDKLHITVPQTATDNLHVTVEPAGDLANCLRRVVRSDVSMQQIEKIAERYKRMHQRKMDDNARRNAEVAADCISEYLETGMHHSTKEAKEKMVGYISCAIFFS